MEAMTSVSPRRACYIKVAVIARLGAVFNECVYCNVGKGLMDFRFQRPVLKDIDEGDRKDGLI